MSILVKHISTILSKKDEIKKYKSILKKKYPNCILKKLANKYYIDDGNGNNLIKEEFNVTSSNPLEAWKNTYLMEKIEPIINRNSYKFNDDKIYNSFIKKNQDKPIKNDDNFIF